RADQAEAIVRGQPPNLQSWQRPRAGTDWDPLRGQLRPPDGRVASSGGRLSARQRTTARQRREPGSRCDYPKGGRGSPLETAPLQRGSAPAPSRSSSSSLSPPFALFIVLRSST